MTVSKSLCLAEKKPTRTASAPPAGSRQGGSGAGFGGTRRDGRRSRLRG